MPDQEMIDRCCLAACEALGSKYCKDKKYGDYTVVEDRTIDIKETVLAVIKAMLEPTEKMLEGFEGAARDFLKADWETMIDNILND